MMEYEWSRLRADELRKYSQDNAVVIVPVAAIEQHGPHLPVMVDSRLTQEVSQRTASLGRDNGVPILTLPVIWHGLSEHHMPYGGTVTLRSNTFFLVVRDIVSSVSRHGFSKFLILNGHGGNITAAEVCAQDISMELSLPIVAATYWLEAADRFAKILETQNNVMHACEAETSMMMALEPDLVDASDLPANAVAADGQPDVQRIRTVLVQAGKHQVDVRCVGVFDGRRIIEVAVRWIAVVGLCNKFQRFESREVRAFGSS